MSYSTLFHPLILVVAIAGASTTLAGEDQVLKDIALMKQEISELKDLLNKKNQSVESEDSINVGGAVRFQYSNEGYDRDNRERGGDLDFDVFRLNFDGQVKDIQLSAEWRWYQYMNVVHHAWLGYDFTEASSIKIGIQQVPFGVRPYNSHSFFFSSNFYVGLEDDYDTGLNYEYKRDGWSFDLGYYFNDELGGIDGYVSNRNDRYSYDVVGVRNTGEGIYDAPDDNSTMAEAATWNSRIAYKLNVSDSVNVEAGLSGQYGQLVSATENIGDRNAYAAHLVINIDRWNLQLQSTRYEYNLETDEEAIVVGSYAFNDTIAAKADTYTANLAYSLPVNLGPVSNLTFYNDYSIVKNKSSDLKDTMMNVTGVLVSAGSLYTYIDFVRAQNQPFIGGSMAGDGGVHHRVNANFGFYF